MELLRLLTIWDIGEKEVDLKRITNGKGTSTIRLHTGVYGTILTVITESLQLHDVATRFSELKRATNNSRCRSLKVFISGSIPDLSDKGMIQNGPTWYSPHKEIAIGAVPYGKYEWCFLIEKRSGRGVPIQALQYIPLADYQLRMEEWEDIS